MTPMNYSAEMLQAIFSNSPIGMYVVQHKKFCYANTKFLDISMQSEKVLLETFPLDIVYPEDQEHVRESAIRMLKDKNSTPYKFRVLDGKGGTKWIVETVLPIIYEGSKAVLGYFMDITDTRKAEDKSKASESKYQSFFQLAREGILIIDYNTGTILDANAEFQRQSGYNLPSLQRKKIWELQATNFRIEAEKSFFRFKENRGGLISWNLCENQNGKVLPVEISAQKIILEDKNLILCMVRDTTEREAMIRALKLASEEWRRSFDALDDVIMLVSPDFKIRRANMAASRLLGKDIHSIIDSKCHELVHGLPHPPDYCPIVKAQALGIYNKAEAEEKHLGKTLNFSAAPIKDESGNIKHCVEVISDVTDARKNACESLRLSKNLAESFNGITEALSGLVESRDPYTAGHSQHVAELAVQVGKEMGLSGDDLEGLQVSGLLHDIGKAIIPAAILNKPGKLSEHEWGMIRHHPVTAYETLQRIPFPWPVADVVHQHHEKLDGSGYPLGLSGKQIHLWAKIIAAADIFDAMTSHRPYRPRLQREKAMEELSRGMGIIYDKDVVHAIQNVLRLDDMRILVTDYDNNVLKGIMEELVIEGIEPTGFTDSEKALKAFFDTPFPLVMTELSMPGMDGVQLTSKIKETHPNTEVIVTAGHYEKSDMLRALRAGASDFIEKPIDIVMFRKSLHRALNRYASKLSK